ncbi:MAG: acetyl-CoA acetyltransferase [Acidimicrobiales bacterium]
MGVLGSARAKAVIAGAADDVTPSGELEGSHRAIEMRMIKAALDDAGLSISDVDGFATCFGTSFFPSMDLAEYLGVTPRWTDTTQTGGSAFEVHVEHAAAAIAAGLCDVVVVTYLQTPRSARKRGKRGFGGGGGGGRGPMHEWEAAYGGMMPPSAYALAAQRHMHEFGTTSEQLAQIAVSTREWAQLNPRARYQEPLTIDEVLSSRMVSSPLHSLDCCLITDGAGCVVLTSAERAKDLRKPPAYILGVGTSHTHSMISAMPDFTRTAGAVSGPQAFTMAGVTPAEVDVLQSYDSFTITVLLALEDLGFVKKGEGGPFAASGALGPGGSLPTNTNGGGLSYCHPGMYGMFLLVEAVRQLRGEAGPRQVDGAQLAVAHGCGGVLSSTSTVVLGTEATV